MINLLECWNCDAKITFAERAAEDGQCPHCHAEIDLEDELIRLQDIVKTMLDNDGCDGRYDAHEFLIARDRLRELTATAKAQVYNYHNSGASTPLN